MDGRRILGIVAAGTLAVTIAACGAGSATGGAGTASSAAVRDRGGELYAANCAACHGPDLRGTEAGPPLLHEYYVPSHHADEAFQVAVARGVSSHHWDHGPMPPVPGLDRDDVAAIVAFVRERQRAAGLID